MKQIFFPNPLRFFPQQQLHADWDKSLRICFSTPLFEDYKYGDCCIVDWDQMQYHSDHRHLSAKTLQKFEDPAFISY